MKRTAAEAFGEGALAPSAAAFHPTGAALLDPRAYFAQWQQGQMTAPPPLASQSGATRSGAMVSASSTYGGGAAASGAAVAGETQHEVATVSAVRCAAIVKEKGVNFTLRTQVEALFTMATKSSFKLREELVKQPHVRKLCGKVLECVRQPPPSIAQDLPLMAKAVWSLARFPEDVHGEAQQFLNPAARLLGATLTSTPSPWEAESATKVLWCLARKEAIYPHKQLVSQVVKEMVKDKGARVNHLSHEGLNNLLFSIARARLHNHKGDHRTVQLEENDELLFDLVAQRVTREIDTVGVHLLGDLVHTHAEVGLRKEAFFRAICPRILKDQQELRGDVMAKIIKAYTRFMIPLKEEPQGFRTMAVVAKGDFMRPSDKPKRTGKKTFDKPQSLFPRTQLHSRA